MPDAAVFLTDGFEEIEALTVLDILRRGECDAVSVSLVGSHEVTGSHRITVQADITYEAFENVYTGADMMLILPGGPGTAHYKKHEPLLRLLCSHHGMGGRIAAICAAPSILGMLGLLEGKTAVCYPSFEETLTGAHIGRNMVETDGTIITSKGPATALLFSLEILQAIKGRSIADKVREQTLETQVREAYAPEIV